MTDSLTRWLPPSDPSGPVTCVVCGCRLTAAEGFEGAAWRHFPSLMPGQDARGCRPRCLDQLHGRDGRVSELLDQVGTLMERDAESLRRAGGSEAAGGELAAA